MVIQNEPLTKEHSRKESQSTKESFDSTTALPYNRLPHRKAETYLLKI